jgi:hypothetical protein
VGRYHLPWNSLICLSQTAKRGMAPMYLIGSCFAEPNANICYKEKLSWGWSSVTECLVCQHVAHMKKEESNISTAWWQKDFVTRETLKVMCPIKTSTLYLKSIQSSLLIYLSKAGEKDQLNLKKSSYWLHFCSLRQISLLWSPPHQSSSYHLLRVHDLPGNPYWYYDLGVTGILILHMRKWRHRNVT